jgi:menaquinone-specific isochorismate synthase
MPTSVRASAASIHLARVIRRLDSTEGAALLEAFLRAHAGQSTGFWGRGEAFEVWGGVAQEVILSGGSGNPSRIGALRATLPRVVAETCSGPAGSEARVPPPRWYGGLSFLEDPERAEGWDGFPAARFILPRALLSVEPTGATLVMQGPQEEGEGMPDAVSALVRVLSDASGAIPEGPPQTPDALPGETSEERGSSAWAHAIDRVLEAEGRGELDKVVLARTRDVRVPRPVSVPSLLRFLRAENPRAHVFMFEPEPGRILFGAAPEVLASARGGDFFATAVAGSAPRGKTVHEDQLLRGGLLTSLKDRAEHRMTVEAMVAALEPRLEALEVPRGPGVLALARIQHLETPIRGRLRAGEDILSLVEALHPTPAVCGRPQAEAMAWIREVEPFDRGWYAGPVGWLDGQGDGEFVPALRAGVGGGTTWRLYAGAGIVRGSDPHSEWEETALKFEPAHRALRAGVLG